MAFLIKGGNIVGRSMSKPYIFQAIRCLSYSKLYIGGLSYSTDNESLREAFGKYGDVVEAKVILDRESGRSRGFGFVTFSSVEDASAAMQAWDQQELHGRRIRVDFANERVPSYGGGGNFGGGGGGGSEGGGDSFY